MKKILFLAIALIALNAATLAQEKEFSPSIQIGYNYMGGDMTDLPVANGIIIYSGGSLALNADLVSLSNRMSFGAHLDFGPSAIFGEDWFDYTKTVGIHYGIDLSYRVLNPSIEKWDVSLNGRVGSYWCPRITPQVEYGLGVRATYYPSKHFGIYAEMDWGNFRFNKKWNGIVGHSNSKLGIGVSFRF